MFDTAMFTEAFKRSNQVKKSFVIGRKLSYRSEFCIRNLTFDEKMLIKFFKIRSLDNLVIDPYECKR